MGDYAIALAERRFFEEFFPDNTLIEVTMPDWKDYETEYKKIVSERDILCISGGGYIGDMWQSGGVLKEIVSAFPNNIKFLLPNTLTYINNDEETMKIDARFYSAQNNLYIFARDENSYCKLLEYQYRQNDQIALFPDMALLLNFTGNDIPDRNGVILCFRQDKEKACSDDTIDTIKKILVNNEILFFEPDIHLYRTVKRKDGESELQKKLSEFSQAKLVITDRLHGMIFAAITGTPCIAFDNSTGKVAGVYLWIQKLPYIKLVSEEEISEGIIREALSFMACKYENNEIQEHMRRMAKLIKDVAMGESGKGEKV
jgi:pyruvyl transferase EpsI